jgi:hypothetical protein
VAGDATGQLEKIVALTTVERDRNRAHIAGMTTAPKSPGPDNRRLAIALGGLIAMVVGVGICFAIIAIAFWNFQP